MTAGQFRQAIADLGLSQGEAANFLGVHINTAWNWANDVAPVPDAVAKLLRLMVDRRIAPADLNG